MSIELEPSAQLGFHRPLTEAIKESLFIRNPTQLPIAFKVKTTAPKQYCVRPNSGRIEPGQELEVQVQMQAMKEDPPADFKCKDKFLVQSVAITAEREQLSLADLWPAIERDAKDQIREKKIRCVFLPPVGQEAIPQTAEENEHGSTSRASSAPHSAHSTINGRSASAATPTSPTHPVTADVSAQSTLPSAATASSTTGPSSSAAEVTALKRELQIAHETIQKLQGETTTLRQRVKVEAGSSSSSSSGPVMTAINLKPQQEGYPVTYVIGAAAVAFLFAYLFF